MIKPKKFKFTFGSAPLTPLMPITAVPNLELVSSKHHLVTPETYLVLLLNQEGVLQSRLVLAQTHTAVIPPLLETDNPTA
jgi:hypothetical protein